MKKIYYAGLLCILGTMAMGCNDWLDVNPRSQIRSDKLFETENGYKLALNGVYINIADAHLYGKYTTMYIADGLARMWTPPMEKTALLYGVSNHVYTEPEVENSLSTIFLGYYNAIAQLNDILTNLDGTSVSFEYNNDQFIRAEALGLRAFLHLDLLRFFGPVPSEAQDDTRAIPYATDITTDTKKLLSKSWKEVIDHIEKDLNDAEEILKLYDPVINTGIDSLKIDRYIGKDKMPKDGWQFFRQGRFNYYAVLGTKARLHHWAGNKEQAVKYARMVIDSKKFPLCDESYLSGIKESSLVMYQEHLFGLENPDLSRIVEPLFTSKKAELTQTVQYIKTAYEGTIHVNDIRYVNNRFWQEKTYDATIKVNHFYKYTGNDMIRASNRIPLLRSVEMYFILMEDLPLAETRDPFVKYRQSRALSSSIDESSVFSETALLAQLEKEYRKEFYGEGQMFFFYKKYNYKQFTWPAKYTPPTGAYVLPKPKGMIDFE